ncbi:protein kinase [bacterium]|nr:protein kinase [bacterium]
MTQTQNATSFLDNLERSRLLTEDQIVDALERLNLGDEDPAIDVAKAFVANRVLTRLQASRLLEGRYRGFFIDHFRIDDILGSGGMGWVYIATDLESGEKVALKMLCEQSSNDAGLLTRFKLEARAGMQLEHEAIVQTKLISVTPGLYGDIHYTVMEYMEGVGVDELVAMGGAVAAPQACHIARYAAAGLHHAHARGLVHRDIKPANILVDKQCHAKVLDFGLSLASNSAHEDEFSLAMIFGHDCLGTADYIAPEQVVDSFNIDRRADIYSLGATLYFMLTGQVMFPQYKTRAEKIAAQQHEHPRPIREVKPSVPEHVAAIVMKMLEKDPDRRFDTAKQVAFALEPLARPTTIQFDFRQILDRRYAIAQQRKAFLDQRSANASAATSMTMCSLDSRATRPPQASIETAIHKDTRVDNRAEPEPIDDSDDDSPDSGMAR